MHSLDSYVSTNKITLSQLNITIPVLYERIEAFSSGVVF